jgi:hypothetical protein
MMTSNSLLATAGCLVLALSLAGCEGDDGRDGAPGPAGAPGADGADGADGAPGSDANAALSLTFLGRTAPLGGFDESAAEIVAYHPATVRAFVVNAEVGKVDIIDLQDPAAPNRVGTLDVGADVEAAEGLPEGAMGDVNSVDISGDTLAVALAADVPQENGYIAIYTADGTFLSAVEAGALPDKVGFSPDGRYAVSANEGEPNDDYSVDPEGSLTIVDLSAGLDSPVATTVGFTAFNADGSRTLTGPVRIAARSESVAQDLEPEFVAFSADSSTVYAILQENNAVAIADLASGEVSAVLGLGFKDYGLPGNELDPSNRDGGVNIRSWSVFGTYMPDGFDSYEVAGITYLVTANEGDGREYLTDAADETDCAAQGGFLFDDGDCLHYLDEIRVKDLDPSQFTDALRERLGPDFQDDARLGRLKVITDLGLVDPAACATLATSGQPLLFPDEAPAPGCVYENLYSFGARSFTIWDTGTGRPVFDSGSDFELITARQLGAGSFNASNDDDEGDDRSDDKGPEPEAVELAEIGGNVFAFIALERVGGVMVYNISNPQSASFVQYVNSRAFSGDAEADVAAGVSDLGPEDIKFVPAADSPNGEPLLLVSNEVSGTLAVYSVSLL